MAFNRGRQSKNYVTDDSIIISMENGHDLDVPETWPTAFHVCLLSRATRLGRSASHGNYRIPESVVVPKPMSTA